MTSFLIETSVIIDYLKGNENAKVAIETAKGRHTSSYFCLAELYEGIKRVKDPIKHEQSVLTYFKSLGTIYGLDMRIAQKFGELRAHLRKTGSIIEDMDLFIAATCLAYDLTLITNNAKHFSRVVSLKVFSG